MRITSTKFHRVKHVEYARLFKALVLAGTIVIPTISIAGIAGFVDGNRLVKDMRENEAGVSGLGAALYTGYVMGVADVSAYSSWCPNPDEVTCWANQKHSW
jgi:hypothetical protein